MDYSDEDSDEFIEPKKAIRAVFLPFAWEAENQWIACNVFRELIEIANANGYLLLDRRDALKEFLLFST